MTTVAVTNCNSYSEEEVRKALYNSCDNAGFPDVKGKKVLLKPNILSDAQPSDSITTNPMVVRQAIRYCKDKGASEIYVGDSPGMQNSGFKPIKSGIYAVCIEEGAKWVDFTQKPVIKTLHNVGTKVPAASIVDEADVIIGLCKMKNHQLMYVTGAVKNFFGVIPTINKSQCHLKFQSREAFARMLINLHETVKPDFSIMDAVVSMEGPGPANGTPRKTGLLLASDNDYALDQAQAIIMGYEPLKLPLLSEADKQHLIPKEIDYPALNLSNLVISDFVRIPYRNKTQFFSKLVLPFFGRWLERRKQQKEQKPVFNKEKCINCLKCVNICPGSALTFDKDNKCIVPDYKKCIRCYCCHEMCPVAAIEVKGRNND